MQQQERPSTKQRYVAYYTGQSERHKHNHTEIDKIYMQLQRVWEQGSLMQQLELTLSLHHYQEQRGYWRDWERWNTNALTNASSIPFSEDVGFLHNNLGRAYHRLGTLSQAVHHFQCALDIFTTTQNEIGIATVHNNMGLLAETMGEWQEAILCHQKAITLRSKLDLQVQVAESLSNLGALLSNLSRWDEALTYLQRALTIQIANNVPTTTTRINIANVYFQAGQPELAQEHYEQALHQFRKLGHAEGQIAAHDGLGILAAHKGDIAIAHTHYVSSLSIW